MKQDVPTIVAVALAAGFVGWIILGNQERSALRHDPHELARRMSSDPALLRVSQNSPHMRTER